MKTIVSAFNTLQALASSIVIKKVDQLDQATVTVRRMFQANVTQASESPTTETITGLEGSASVSMAKDVFKVFGEAFNTPVIAGATANDPGLLRISDNAGLTVGACVELPYKTVVFRPYGCGETVITDPELWIIFPFALLKGDASIPYGIGTQFSYTLNIAAYPNPDTGKDRVWRGATNLLPATEYPT
jgi:hypothetical protein